MNKIRNRKLERKKKQLDIRNNKDKKKLLIYKQHFLFKNNIASLLYFKKHSNIFLVLSADDNQHVITLTSGNCRIGRTRKQKISPYNIYLLIEELNRYFILYRIRKIKFMLKTKISSHFYNIIKYLEYYKIKINECNFILHHPHNGTRGRNSRRV